MDINMAKLAIYLTILFGVKLQQYLWLCLPVQWPTGKLYILCYLIMWMEYRNGTTPECQISIPDYDS